MTDRTLDQDPNERANELILSAAPDHELEELLADLEETASILRDELDARHGRPASNLTPEQHAEIDRLPEYLELSRTRWTNVVSFLREFKAELREARGK